MTHETSSKIRRAADWSESAFQEVYSRYIRPLYSYIVRRVRNHHDAEDLAAHVFAQALKHLRPSKPGNPELEGWLFKSAHNATVNHARGKRFRTTISIEEMPEEQGATDLDSRVSDNQDLERLFDAVSRLPEEQRRAIVLRFVQELSHAEIAEVLGRTESSSRVLIHRTLADLRREVS